MPLINEGSNTRIASDGTTEGTVIEVRDTHGAWVVIRDCVAVKLHAQNGDEPRFLELTILGPLTDVEGTLDLTTIDTKKG